MSEMSRARMEQAGALADADPDPTADLVPPAAAAAEQLAEESAAAPAESAGSDDHAVPHVPSPADLAKRAASARGKPGASDPLPDIAGTENR